MVEIREVKTYQEKRRFASFNADMYKKLDCAPPDIVEDEMDNFNPKKNPSYEFCKVKQFLAYRDGECVGRIGAIINSRAIEKFNDPHVRFTRVDFIDDPEVSGALFKAVEDFGRENGCATMKGPLGFTDLDQEGMLIEGFEYAGPFFTIYNYPYYKQHMEDMGFVKDADWIEYRISVPPKPPEKIAKLANVVMSKCRLTLVEPQNRKELKPYIKQIFELLNKCYSQLYGMVELTDAQKQKYYDQFIMLVNTEFLKIIVDENKEMVGFGLAIPSMNDAVNKCNGRLFPFGWYSILRAPFRPGKTLDLYLVGVLPEYQKKGLPAILLNAMYVTAAKHGIEYAETGPELETNMNVAAMWKYYDRLQHKRRRSWIKKIDQ